MSSSPPAAPSRMYPTVFHTGTAAAPMRGYNVEVDKESTGKKLKRRFVRSVEERSDMKVTLKKNDDPSASSPTSPPTSSSSSTPPPPPPPPPPSSAPATGAEFNVSLMRDKHTADRDIYAFEDSQAGEDIPSPLKDMKFKSKSQSVDISSKESSLFASVNSKLSAMKSRKGISEEVEDIMDTDEEEQNRDNKNTKGDATSHTVHCAKVIPSSSSHKNAEGTKGRLSKILKNSSPKTSTPKSSPKKTSTPKISPAISRMNVHDAEVSVHENDVPAYLSSTSNWATIWKALRLAGWTFKKGTGLVDGHYLRPGNCNP